MDKISIIVPVYNVEKFLRECLDSIINQTYKNIEVICVDDGSTDDSGIICDEYAMKYSNIKVIHKINGGLSDARNVGIKVSTGEYLAFVDSDDVIYLDFIKILYTMCVNNNCDIAECDYQMFEDEKIFDYSEENFNQYICSSKEMQERLYCENSVRTITTWNKLYKRFLFDDIEFPVGKIHEDQYVIYKILYNANNIAVTDSKMYFYRFNPDSITKRKFSINRYDIIGAFEERLDFYKKNNENNLYYACDILYQYVLQSLYYQTQIHIKTDKHKYKKNLMDKIKLNYNNVLKYTSIANRVKHGLFIASPLLYAIIRNIIMFFKNK